MGEGPPSPAKSSKRKAAKAKRSGPNITERIIKVVSASSERKGVSLVALKKGLAAGGYDVENKARVKLTIKALVAKDILIHVKGTGATGSFKINKNVVGPKYKMTADKKVPPKAKKSKAKKPAAKKPKVAATSKKPTTTKKSPRKAPAAKKMAKSPKVVKKAPTVRKAPAKAAKKAVPKK